jgi:hypothetical protein
MNPRSTTGVMVSVLVSKAVDRGFISGVVVSVLVSKAVDRGFQPQSGQTKDFKIGICCFSAKHAALRRKSEDWLARYQNIMSEWSNMSTRGLLAQTFLIAPSVFSNVYLSWQ